MINNKDLERFFVLRKDLFKAIRKDLEEDGHCKNYEGSFTIHLPHYFEEIAKSKDGWCIELDLYLIAPSGRHHEWCGNTFREVLDKAEKDIRDWISLHE